MIAFVIPALFVALAAAASCPAPSGATSSGMFRVPLPNTRTDHYLVRHSAIELCTDAGASGKCLLL